MKKIFPNIFSFRKRKTNINFFRSYLRSILILGLVISTSSLQAASENGSPDGHILSLVVTSGGSNNVNDNQTVFPFSDSDGGLDVVILNPKLGSKVSVEVALDDANKGVFTVGSLAASGFVDQGNGVYTLEPVFTIPAIAALRQLNYNPTDNRVPVGNAETTTFRITVDNGTSTASNNTTNVVSTSVNDQPTVTGGGDTTKSDKATSVFPFSASDGGLDATINDVDPLNDVQTDVVINETNQGTFVNAVALGFAPQGGGVFSLPPTSPSNAQSLLRQLAFNPVENLGPVGSTSITSFSIVVSDGFSPPVSDTTTTVTAISENDAPTVSGGGTNRTLDIETILPFDDDDGEGLDAMIGDVDPGSILSLSVALDNNAKGVFTNAAALGFTGSGPYFLPGATPATVESTLRQLIFDPTDNRVPSGSVVETLNASGSDRDTFPKADPKSAASPVETDLTPSTVDLDDDNSILFGSTETTIFTITVNDGIAPPVSDSTTKVISTSVNDAPTVSGGGTNQTLDTATILPFDDDDGEGLDALVSDVDPGSTLSLSVALDDNAKGIFTNAAALGFTGSGPYVLPGAAPATVESTLRQLIFDPTENRVPVGDTETTTFTITVSDGIALPISDNSTTVISTSVNDAPVMSGGGTNQTLDTVIILPFDDDDSEGLDAMIGDVDPASILFLSVALDDNAKGIFTNAAALGFTGSGPYVLPGAAPATVESTLRQLIFDPTDDRVVPGLSETTTFTLVVDDGIAPSVSDSTTTVISTSVNDAPMVSGGGTNQTLDTVTILPFDDDDGQGLDATLNDTDPNGFFSLTVALDDNEKGFFTNASALGFTGSGPYTLSNTTPLSAVEAALRQLIFEPTDNLAFPGTSLTTTFTITVDDGISGPVSDSTTTVESNNAAPFSIEADVEPASLVVGDTGVVDITFTAAEVLPGDGVIKVVFPRFKTDSFDLSAIGPMGFSPDGSLDGDFFVTVESNFDFNDTVKIARSGGTDTFPGTHKLRLTNIKNPDTTGTPLPNYTVVTLHSDGQFPIEIGTSAPDDIVDPLLEETRVESICPMILATSDVRVFCRSPEVVPATLGTRFQITFPEGFDISEIHNVFSEDIDGTITFSTKGQILTVTRQGDGTDIPVNVDPLVMTISGVRNPEVAEITETFRLAIINNFDEIIAADPAVPGIDIQLGKVSLADSIPSVTTTVNLELTTTVTIPEDCHVVFNFPSGFDISECVTEFPNGITGSFSTDVSGQTISIIRDGTGGVIEPGVLEINVINIINPTFPGLTDNFSVQVTEGDGTPIMEDDLSGVFINDPAQLTNENVSTESFTGGSPVTFSVDYSHSQDEAPSLAQIKVDLNADGYIDPCETFFMTTTGTDFATGVTYEVTLNLDYKDSNSANPSIVNYTFCFKDANRADVVGEATQDPAGSVEITAPLSIPNLSDPISDPVPFPDGNSIVGNTVQFSVEYFDANNTFPTVAELFFDVNGDHIFTNNEIFPMTQDPTDLDEPSLGITFLSEEIFVTDIGPDFTREFFFNFSNGSASATGGPAEIRETGFFPGSTDLNGNGVPDNAETGDTDNDGTPDVEDTDSTSVMLANGDNVGLILPDGSMLSDVNILGLDDPVLSPVGQPVDVGLGFVVQFTSTVPDSDGDGDPIGDTLTVFLQFEEGSLAGDPPLWKYNPNTGEWFEVFYTLVNPTTLSYEITDGGALDADGSANGIVVDPIGLGSGGSSSGVGGIFGGGSSGGPCLISQAKPYDQSFFALIFGIYASLFFFIALKKMGIFKKEV